MNERFKVLGAMLALREFTAVDLAEFSGVNVNTVRVVLGREKWAWEETGRRSSGQRGGQFIQYRVKSAQFPALEKTIDGLLSEAKSIAFRMESTSGAAGTARVEDTVPVLLLAAEDALGRRFPEAATLQDRVHLLSLSEIAASKYGEICPAGSASRAHLAALEILREICLAELAQETGSAIGPVVFSVLREQILSAADSLIDKGAPHQAALLLKRVLAGPLVQPETTLQWKLHVLAEAVTHTSHYVRLVAVRTLGKIVTTIRGSESALPSYEVRVLMEALKAASADEDEQIRNVAEEIRRHAEFLPSTQPADRPLSEQRLLIVDDEETVGGVIVEQLRRYGYAAEYEADPCNVLQRMQKKAFDIVVTDYIMKGMNGIELAKLIHAKFGNLPVVLMSGYVPEVSGSDNFVAFVSKGIIDPELTNVIREHIGEPRGHLRYA